MNLVYGSDVIGKRLRKQQNVRKIQIVTAFIEQYGIEVLKDVINNNSVSKNNVEIYLSYNFSSQNSYEILNELYNLGTIYLVENLHAKVFYLQGDEDLLIYGSANLTYGGLMKNIEFYNIEEEQKILEECSIKLKYFLEKCTKNGKLVTDEVIEEYKIYAEAIKEEMKAISREKSRKIMNSIKGITSKTQDAEVYKELEEYYFNKNDYEVFEEYHTDENNADIRQKRIHIQEKLLNINEIVKEKCENLGLYNHWKKENITSSIEPNPFNNWKLNWIGIRYGRHKNQIDELNTNDSESIHYGFHKYCCMQFNISLDNFEIGIYHAVANDAVDRTYLREALEKDDNIRKKLIEELKKLKGNNLVWTIWSPYKEIQEMNFSLDNDNIEDFPEFYLENDKEGCHSSLMFRFAPNDERLKNKESISDLIIEKFELLLPLYNTIIWKKGENPWKT